LTTPSYILMTAARNEARFLPGTIASVLAQQIRPAAWVIVSDGSTDDTDRIAAEAAAAHGFIRFLRHDNPGKSPYAMGGISWKKVTALNAGLASLGEATSDYLGNLDADVSFAPDLFARLLARMQAAPDVGLGGAFVYNVSDGVRAPYFASPDTVGGPLQLFRREAWEAIGGYLPFGQEDTIAQIMVRMHGYRVRAFAELEVLHHKTAKSKGRNPLKGQFHAGAMERAMGFHPLHVTARCAAHGVRAPLGSGARLAGYAWAAARGLSAELPPEVVAFNRRQQLENLRRRLFGSRGGEGPREIGPQG
jgi:cellulose synthase/poly-beta-1,6-N-acetylglucosamine synthase-like glycosyltransferase